ncbi:MAG: AAA family ATPase [Rhodospirillales bacterium]
MQRFDEPLEHQDGGMKADRGRAPGAERKPARIEYLRVKNYRALRDVEFKQITPLTVLLGPNGSGKSTVFDVFAFLSECFESGLRRAWDRRGRAKELKTRGSDGPLVIEIKYRQPPYPVITYHLAVRAVQFSRHKECSRKTSLRAGLPIRKRVSPLRRKV